MAAEPQSETQTLTEPHHEQPSTTTTVTASAELAIIPTENSNPSQSPKFQSRPRKIRKLDNSNPTQNDAGVAQTAKPTKHKLVPHRVAAPAVPSRSLTCGGEIEIALRHLRSADPLLAPLIDIHQPPTFDTCRTPFLALTRSILYQQLALKAGTSIFTRFVALCGGENGVVPETVLSLNPQQLRQIGVSGRKASYLHDLARKYQNGILSDSSILSMDDKSLFTMLTMVNGIGSWSVHMFMIFSLRRPDVLPINDGSIRKGVQILYGLEELPRPSQMDQLCEKWRPYRSVASWYLWRLVEAKGAPLSVAGTPSLQQQQQQHLQQPQQQQQQFLDPIHGILNLGTTLPIIFPESSSKELNMVETYDYR